VPQLETDGEVLNIGSLIPGTVDGGHRAIKYTRIGGVGKEIYNEGTIALPLASTFCSITNTA
jgi:hypothetical protein